MSIRASSVFVLFLAVLASSSAPAGTKTWDGKYDTSRIAVTVAYFVPSDRTPLVDWKDRAAFYCRRIEAFHAREFQGQSTLQTTLHDDPVVSELTTAELRRGDANAIFFRTLRETARQLNFPDANREAFPILLVLSEINWRPLDDFYRLKPDGGTLVFEGINTRGRHHPGAASGGARATYLGDRGAGWGLVSADGWRVPYSGSDCVVYHEGVGHTVGLPHPEPADGSVMSMGQYRGGLNESWLDKEQKIRLSWDPDREPPTSDPQIELFSAFRATPEPLVPRPGEPVSLRLEWPADADVKTLRVRFQTALGSPWVEVPQQWDGAAPATAALGAFDRATPLSYRIDAELQDGSREELWGYLQVRRERREIPLPLDLSPDLIEIVRQDEPPNASANLPETEIDLLALADPETCWQTGTWIKESGKLTSPKGFGTRLELPYAPPEEYRLTLIVEPLDPPNGLILGQRSGDRRFVTLINYTPGENAQSAVENVDDRNVGNETTFTGNVLKQNQLAQAIVTVTRREVTVAVDGRTIVSWRGNPRRLSLSDYWKTPDETALFLGAYDCRYRFHRITLEPLTGSGTILSREPAE
jgi:hypothetical protein